ncbi:TIM barrel protein [Terriglobus sp.]|uniref:TIM barrel protein n=1 Tax=Terriglobus sp. TaxID=1889013 RepID=UPI003AFFE20C
MAWTLPKHPTFPQQLQIAADAGYQSIELGNEYEHWTADEWRVNLAAQQRLGIAVDSAIPGRNALADIKQRKALHDDLLRAIPGAQRLGCSQFIYTGYNRVPGQTPQPQRAAIIDSLKYAADLLESANFELVLEPIDLLEHKEETVTSVVEAFDIIRAVGSPRVRVLYDFFHEQRQAGNLIESLEKNIDLVGLVHIADVPGRHRPGTGEINFPNLYRKLADLHYRRVICMEFLPVGDPVTELRQAREEAIRALESA